MQRIDINYDPYKIETEMHVNGVNVCDNIDDYAQFKVFIDDKIPLQMWIEPNDSENWKGIVNELKTDEEGFDILEFHFHGREIDFQDLRRTCEIQNANRVNKIELIFKHDTIRSDKKTDESYQTIIDEFLSQRFSSLVQEQGVDSSVFLEYQKFKDSYKQINEKNVATDSLKIPSGLYSDSEMGQENIAKYLDPYIINRKAELINDGWKVIELISDIQTQSVQDMDKRVDEYKAESDDLKEKEQAEQNRNDNLLLIRDRVGKDIYIINHIKIDTRMLETVRKDVRKRLETDPHILRVKTAPDTQTLKDIEIKHITRQIAGVFEELWDEIENAYGETFAEYNSTISDIVDDLNGAAVQLYDYGIRGYKFSCSTDLEEIQLEDAHGLAEEMLKSKEIKAKWNKTIKRNPIKTKHYNNWQLIGKMKQALAEDTVETGEFIYWNQFSMVSLKTYITEKSDVMDKLLYSCQQHYWKELYDLRIMSTNMAEAIKRVIKNITHTIKDYDKNLVSLDRDIKKCEAEIKFRKDTLKWLNQLKESIENLNTLV